MAKYFLKKIILYWFGGNGHQIRDVIHIDDVCKIIYLQIKEFKENL